MATPTERAQEIFDRATGVLALAAEPPDDVPALPGEFDLEGGTVSGPGTYEQLVAKVNAIEALLASHSH